MIASVCFLYMQLCDFQAVLCTEDEKKIRHLDTLYEVTMLFTRKVLPLMTDTVWRPQKNIDNNCRYMYLAHFPLKQSHKKKSATSVHMYAVISISPLV